MESYLCLILGVNFSDNLEFDWKTLTSVCNAKEKNAQNEDFQFMI